MIDDPTLVWTCASSISMSAWARPSSVLGKTDQVDARTLGDFADVLSRHKDRAKYITPMLDEHRQQLAELMTRRRQLVDMRGAGGDPDVDFSVA